MKGKTVVLMEIQSSLLRKTQPAAYTSESLKSFKFKPEYLYGDSIFNTPLFIEDVLNINIGKKDEALVIKAIKNNETIAIYIPLRYNSESPLVTALWFETHKLVAGFSKVYMECKKEDLIIPYYDYNKIKELYNSLKDKFVYPCKKAASIVSRDDGYSRYEEERNLILLDLERYRFVDFAYNIDDIYSYATPENRSTIKSMSIRLADRKGKIVSLPIFMDWGKCYDDLCKHSSCYDGNPSLSNVSNYLMKEYELIKLSRSKYEKGLIDSIKSKFLNHKVYSIGNSICKGELLQDFMDDDIFCLSEKDEPYRYGVEPQGYYTLENIKMFPSKKHAPFLRYYAILVDSTKEYRYAFPINSKFNKVIITAEEQKEYEKQEMLKEEQEERERLETIEKENREYHMMLVRKYGKTNASIIENEEIRIGFTKAMVEEAWGTPNDINTLTTRYKTTEQWVYGIGSYVYFENGVVIAIQN